MSRKVLRATVLSIVTALLLPLAANANGPQQDTDIVVRTALYGNEFVSMSQLRLDHQFHQFSSRKLLSAKIKGFIAFIA